MNYYITRYTGTSKDAGTKAPKDINAICHRNGWTELPFIQPDKSSKPLTKAVINIKNWANLLSKVKSGDTVLYQHPMYFGTKFTDKALPLLKKKGVKTVALIHDLESLRNLTANKKADEASYQYADLVLLKKFDVVIAHNIKKKKYLVEKGIDGEKVVCLEIFDYLFEGEPKPHKLSMQVAVAGNLDPQKCSYIYDMAVHNPEITVNLYGGNFDNKNTQRNVTYCGSYSPEEIPGVIDAAFGVVWDGTSSDSCVGNTGEYLKYNNPHKTSLYMVAGLPVIVWDQAAIAEFVVNNGVGIAVSSLNDLASTLQEITEQEYEKMRSNAVQVGVRLKSGDYLKKAFLELDIR